MRRSRTASCSASAARYSTVPRRTTSTSSIPPLQPPAQRAEELRRLRAVERAVVPREAEDRLRANLDHVVPFGIADNDRALDDRLEVEDRDLRLVDHRRRHQRAELAGVRDREGAAVDLVGRQLVP